MPSIKRPHVGCQVSPGVNGGLTSSLKSRTLNTDMSVMRVLVESRFSWEKTHQCVCVTHISHIRPVAGVSSQDALQHVVVRTPLQNKSLTSVPVMSSTGRDVTVGLCSPERHCPTFWKTQSEGNVLETSRETNSRLDSESGPSAGKHQQVSHPCSV